MKTKLLILSLLLYNLSLSSQKKVIKGTIKNNKSPLENVTVTIKGKKYFTKTNKNGKYKILANKGDTLLYNLNIQNIQRIVKSYDDEINVVIKNSNILDEVIITGIGVSRTKKATSFSNQKIYNNLLNNTPETDISNAIAGKIAGAQFLGQPSSAFRPSKIRLRGNTNVLYILDGIKINDISDVNPSNILKINVIKGLSATALYGADGKNGVIFMTSKKSTSYNGKITYSSNISSENLYLLPLYQNEYAGGYNTKYNLPENNFKTYNGQKILEYQSDESWGPKMDGTLVRHWDSWIKGDPEYGKLRPLNKNTNNIRDFFRNTLTLNNSLTFEKAGDDYNLRTSITHIKRESPFPNANRETIQIAANGNYTLNDKFAIYSNINYQNRYTLNDPNTEYGSIASNFNQWWQRQLDMKRLSNYKRNGKVVAWNLKGPDTDKLMFWDTPYQQVYGNLKNQYKDALFGKIGISYDINTNLNTKLEIRHSSHNYQADRRIAFGGLARTDYSKEHKKVNNTSLYGITKYSKSLGDFDLITNIGFEIESYKSDFFKADANGGLGVTDFYHISNSINRPTITETLNKNNNQAIFLRTLLGYQNMAFIEGKVRNDWTSTAKKSKNNELTYGLSGSLVLSDLLPKNKTISFLKFRAGYSVAPYLPQRYQLTPSYGLSTPYKNYGTQYLYSGSPTASNPNLVIGKRTEFETGTNIGLFNNNLDIDITYFQRKDKGLPVPVSFDAATGYTKQTVNSGQQTYDGLEIALNSSILKTQDFKWKVGINFATLKRTVDKLYIAPNGQEITSNIISSWRKGGVQLREETGKEWGAIYGRKIKRDKNGTPIYKYTYKNGKVDDIRLQVEYNKYQGNILPDFTGGFTNQMKYKNFNFSFSLDFQKGGKFFSATDMIMHYTGTSINTVGYNDKGNSLRAPVTGGTKNFVNYNDAGSDTGGIRVKGVLEDGTPIDIYRNIATHWKNYIHLHEKWVYDASYVKLRTMRLGYNFPKKFLQNTPFDAVNFAIYGNNLWLIYAEVNGIDTSELEEKNGISWMESGQNPSSRIVGLNVSLTF